MALHQMCVGCDLCQECPHAAPDWLNSGEFANWTTRLTEGEYVESFFPGIRATACRTYPPNPLGLHDMTGNVSEWTRDWFQADYYEHASLRNPSGPSSAIDPDDPRKTVRDWSGSGDHFGGGGTVFARSGRALDVSNIGFRCVVNSSKPIN